MLALLGTHSTKSCCSLTACTGIEKICTSLPQAVMECCCSILSDGQAEEGQTCLQLQPLVTRGAGVAAQPYLMSWGCSGPSPYTGQAQSLAFCGVLKVTGNSLTKQVSSPALSMGGVVRLCSDPGIACSPTTNTSTDTVCG